MVIQCPLCFENTTEAGICDTCADIIEFGYPSFPAFLLEEKKAATDKECGAKEPVSISS